MREIERKNTEAAEGLRELARAEGLALEVLEVDMTSDAHVERAAGHVVPSPPPTLVILASRDGLRNRETVAPQALINLA
jgi:hypothetical protein